MVRKYLEFETSRGMVGTSRGEGGALVFLHGWCLDHHMWMYADQVFGSKYRVVVPDLPGFGRSAALAGPFTWERYADDIGAMLDELDLAEVVLVGFAFGAGVAMHLAARGHPRVGSLVSVGAPGAEFSPYRKMGKAILRDWPDFARRSAQALFHRQQSEATLVWVERMFASTPLLTALDVLELLAGFDPRPLAPRIAVPQLFVQASEDRVSPVGIGEEAAASVVGGSVVVIPDCGHLIVLDAKEQFHDLLRNHLQGPAFGSGD